MGRRKPRPGMGNQHQRNECNNGEQHDAAENPQQR